MVFKRRDRKPTLRALWEMIWPRGGWGRAAKYVRHRLHRLPDPPQKIARGIWAGVFTTFTPFYGLHFVFAALLALVLRGNVLAALLATFFGNPLTYVPIGIVSLQTGYSLLGEEYPHVVERSLGQKFISAGEDLGQNVAALFTGGAQDWSGLAAFWHDVFFPYMIGGVVPGAIAATIAYFLSEPVIRAYQSRRKGALKARIDALKERATSRKQMVDGKTAQTPPDGGGHRK